MSEAIQQPESQLYGGGETPAKPKAPGLWDQLIGIFTEPKALFQKLAVAPSWGWAIGTMIVLSILLVVVWGLKVDVDAMQRPILEKNPQLTTAQIDQAIEISSKFIVPFGILGAAIGAFLMSLFMALVYWLVGMGTAEGQKPSYLHALSTATVPGLVLVPYTLMITLVCALRNIGGLTPEKLSPTSVAYYVQPESPKLYALFSQLDLFVLAYFVMIFLASRYVMRLKVGGAALCTLLTIVLSVGFKVLFAK